VVMLSKGAPIGVQPKGVTDVVGRCRGPVVKKNVAVAIYSAGARLVKKTLWRGQVAIRPVETYIVPHTRRGVPIKDGGKGVIW